jgi:predicted CoA-binding protein
MTQNIENFVRKEHIIVAGVSRNGKKFGNSAVKELQKRGYKISVVHPSAVTLEEIPCVRSCAAAGDANAGLLVVLPPKNVPGILHEAVNAGIKNVWLQQGAESPEAITLAQSLDLEFVSGKCILMYAGNVTGAHKFHRTLMKWFGKL